MTDQIAAFMAGFYTCGVTGTLVLGMLFRNGSDFPKTGPVPVLVVVAGALAWPATWFGIVRLILRDR